ncbi:hypothetical protein PR002_g20107 [Phytophthora rubi]|uniref:Uncharacterized protein n=1 Tax=Phytophthora rubi TaxID=129364 RepID=A0A6A3JNA3_9STRA|nr:hypothetical protein PR002_g20107 [Phytophthora rubi]
MSDDTRCLQHVVPMADKDRCVQWMECDVLDNGEKGLFGRTVDHFPSLFRSADRRVNMNKARDWWKKRSALQLALEDGRQHKYARSAMGGRHQLVLKAISGRGRKLDAHWDWLYPQLLQEFERLRRAGLKLSSRLLIDMATTMIEDSPHEVFNKAYRFGGKTFSSLVTPRRIQDFTERHNIVYRKLKDKKQVSNVKMAQIEQSVTHHLGTLKRMFDDEVLDPSQQFNMDESHFVIDLDDSKTLDFRGADKVKYRSIVSDKCTAMCYRT